MSSLDIDPFDITKVCMNGRFNPNHLNVSKIYTNTNLDLGPEHWQIRGWNPKFGDIKRYKICEWIGDGFYSDVFTGLQDGKVKCAIKLLKPVNSDRVRRELKILTEAQGPNVLKLLDIVIDGKEGIPAMITELCPNIPYRTLFATMKLDDIKFYLYRVIQALDHAHRCGIMHRDVKPLNIFCNDPRKSVKLGDWGLGEFYHPFRKYSVHVATRYYKSPEILLDYEYYDYSLDMWSVGVILLELLTQKIHIFDGNDNFNQIYEIAKIVGGKSIIDWANKYHVALTDVQLQKFSSYKKIPFIDTIPSNRSNFKDPEALDLLEKLLIVDHRERITAAEALNHSFFKLVRDFDYKRNNVESE